MTFAYHKSLAPMMCVVVALMAIELIIVHILVAIWFPIFALILSVLSLAMIIWFVMIILSFKTLPVCVRGHELHLYAGKLRFVTIPIAQIEGELQGWSGDDLQSATVMNLALIAYPNIMIGLKNSVKVCTFGRTRMITAVAHKFDDLDTVRTWLLTLNAEKTPL
jgi:hypothetical protein